MPNKAAAFLLLLSLSLTGPCLAQPAAAAPSPDLVAAAQSVVELLAGGDYPAAAARFDQPIPPEALADMMGPLFLRAGPFRTHLAARADGDDIVLTTEFANDYVVDFRVRFDSQGRVSGFHLKPGEPPVFPSPAYADPAAFTEQEVTVGQAEWQLPGTLTLPVGEGPYPAVVLVHGSGESDRDETTGPSKPFRDLAWGLASRGVAVLRCEKRSKHYPEKWAAIKGTATLKEETVDDALAAVALLKAAPRVDPARVFVLGHSLGGYAAPRIAAADPSIAGLIIMAGLLEDTIPEAVHRQEVHKANLDGRIDDGERQRLLDIGRKVPLAQDPSLTPDTPLEQLPCDGNFSASFFLDLRDYRPAAAALQLPQPILALQGENDWQVTATDFENAEKVLLAKENAVFRLYPGLNHCFLPAPRNTDEFDDAKRGHIPEAVIHGIATWLTHP